MIRQIGKGSYGEVWLGRGVTGALRAVKVVSRADFEHERTFEREFEGIKSFEPISRKHPGLVNILHVGRNRDEGFYYYVMELADDRLSGREIVPELYVARTLSSDITEETRLSMDACASWGAVMADALEHMHQSGLAHRDVKPSNVIFVDGVPKLADIGLVAASGQRTFVGTEGFVPPEGPGEPGADIYSLGMVLYEMSTGNDRLEFPSVPQMRGDEGERRMWRRMNSIVCKACSPSPKDRYGSAREMRNALQAMGAGIDPPSSFSTVLFRMIVFSGLLAAVIVGLRNYDLFGAYAAGKEIAYADLGAGGAPTAPAPVMGVTPPPNIHVPPPVPDPPEAKFGSIKITTIPPGARVIQIGELGKHIDKGETSPDYFDAEVMPGEVAFELVLEGYRTMPVRGFVSVGKTLLLGGKLEFYQPPVEGESWVNSRGIGFAFIDDRHVGERPFSPEEFAEFLAEREGTIDFHRAVVVPAGDPGEESYPTPLVSRQVGSAFCDWLTAEEQRRGFLAEDHYYTLDEGVAHEVRDLVYGKDVFEQRFPLFTSVRRANFATLTVDSEPRGAGIYIRGEYRGTTRGEVPRLRPGPLEIKVRLAGYRQEMRQLELLPGENHQLSVKLRESAGVIFGQPWTNGLGMKMLPLNSGVMMAAWETRVKDFDAFCAAEKRESTHHAAFPQGANHPAVNVNHNDAVAYCEWLTELERGEGLIEPIHSYRLPTDREWSLAAGLESEGGESPAARDRPVKGVFPWGGQWPPSAGVVNLADVSAKDWLPAARVMAGYDDGFARTAPVGSFEPNPLGFYDLAGNVWEWVGEPYGGRSSFKVWAVARGGGYDTSREEHFLSSYRNVQPPDQRGTIHGFRVVLAGGGEEVPSGAGDR